MEKRVAGGRAREEEEEERRKVVGRAVMMLRVVCAGTRPRHDERRLDSNGRRRRISTNLLWIN